MSDYVLTPQADSDLEAILRYSTQKWGAAQAEKYLRELDAFMCQLGNKMISGRPCDKLVERGGEGLCFYHANRHYIIYRMGSDCAEIIALYHDQMDLERHLLKLSY